MMKNATVVREALHDFLLENDPEYRREFSEEIGDETKMVAEPETEYQAEKSGGDE